MPGVHLPADVELEDRLAFGLTGRQLAILAATAAGAYGTETVLGAVLPLPLALAGATLAALAGAALALARRDGLHGDELALAFARFALAPRTLVLAPDGLPAPLARRRLGALEPPVARIYGSGVVERADGTHCRVLLATGTSFALRDPAEQAAFVAAFGRFLNGIDAPLQIHLSSEPASLEPHARAIERHAGTLPDRLADAAADHARYLRGLGNGEAPLRRRRILVVIACRHRSVAEAATALARSADQARELLAAAGVALTPLTGEETAEILASLVALPGAPSGARFEGIVGARS